jgi:hypothetical protein
MSDVEGSSCGGCGCLIMALSIVIVIFGLAVVGVFGPEAAQNVKDILGK